MLSFKWNLLVKRFHTSLRFISRDYGNLNFGDFFLWLLLAVKGKDEKVREGF